ncbi:MFS transporter [Thermocrinis sp.]|jgi:MFS family permease|uniref:MFS transporter n=1 Tax=Thermocrinis sp. TaxID=2024383 RepID=UPI003C03F7A5
MLKSLTKEEKRVILGISFAVAVRMLGLFLLLPVLSPYLKTLDGATPFLIGLAIGVYGFSQAFLQIPFGYLSDKLGRKPVIIFGMATYILGSLMGGMAKNIWFMVLARFIQGFGAVSSAMTALSADLTREEVRTRAFAFIGASISLVFTLSIVFAPIVAGTLGVPFIFYLTALLSLLATLYVALFIPEPKNHHREIEPTLRNFSLVLKDKNQAFLNLSIALLHAFLVVVFTVVPYQLVYEYQFPKVQHWKVYLPALLLSLAFMVSSIVYAEKKKKFREVFLLGVLLIALGFLLSLLKNSFVALVLLVFFFLLGFHLLEPIIPSLLTRLTHRDIRGLSLGFFNTTQFVGAFLGGLWGGFVLKHGPIYMTTLGFLFSLLWFFGAYLWFKRL